MCGGGGAGGALQDRLAGLHGCLRHKMKMVESDQETLVGKLRSQNFEFSPSRWKQGSKVFRFDFFFTVILDLVIRFFVSHALLLGMIYTSTTNDPLQNFCLKPKAIFYAE